MARPYLIPILLTFVTGACAHRPSAELGKVVAPGLAALSAARLEESTKYLASDALEGRAPGSKGGLAAEAWMADRFRELGLEPAGDAGTYLQAVPLREARRDDARTSLTIHTKGGELPLVGQRDALFWAEPGPGEVDLDAPLAFVGYGISRPDLGYDDLAGVDLHGAIAVVFGGAPRSIGGEKLDHALHAVLSDIDARTLALRAHGASAVILVYDPLRATRMPFASFLERIPGVFMTWMKDGKSATTLVLPLVSIGASTLDRLLAAAGATETAESLWTALDRGEAPKKVALDANASLHIHFEARDLVAHNVAALLRGSDPALANEVVVYTAHLDHLGVGPAVNGDTIYNGAIDNAIGAAALLELAHGFAALPTRPRRSVLFLAVAAEEKGCLGSDYFATHPTVPLEKIVANLNLDGLTPNYRAYDIVALGMEHSSLIDHVRAAAAVSGHRVSPDPDPEQVYFIRSDQYSFVKRGIPAIFAAAGFEDEHGDQAANRKLSDEWSEKNYHQPTDEWRPEYRADWALLEVQFHLAVGLSVANAPERPHWNPGDVFEPRPAAQK